jgi:hypothetical protein
MRRAVPASLTLAIASLVLALPAAATAAVERGPAVVLPGDAAAAGMRAERGTWIVGARPGRTAARIAAAHGARHFGADRGAAYVLRRDRARGFAAALRRDGALLYAQPNVLRRTFQRAVGEDPYDNGWRDLVADPAIAPPAVTDTSPLIALVDSPLDATHPEFAVGSRIRTIRTTVVSDEHGTATASVAAAAQNGIGLTGLWPGARALNIPLEGEISCVDSANGITEAVRNRAAVVNMSYGAVLPCRAETDAVQIAVASGVVPVAAAGNEQEQGNPPEFPASLPHVVSVASIGADGQASAFSNANAAIDLAAPGEGIPTAVPLAEDTHGLQDGFTYLSGTSFAAPMVAAAIAWVRAARPKLTADQAANVVRYSARDVAPEGYDYGTGYGVLSVGGALSEDAPPADPREPNDDTRWVDGRAFTTPDRLLYRGTGRRTLRATLDRFEDPADVYRVRVRGRGRVKLSAAPSYGDVTLTVYSPGTVTIADRRRRVARSAHAGRRTERITLANRSRRARTFFVALTPTGSKRLDAGYTLRISR